MFLYDQEKEDKKFRFADILGAAEEWGYDRFLEKRNQCGQRKVIPKLMYSAKSITI